MLRWEKAASGVKFAADDDDDDDDQKERANFSFCSWKLKVERKGRNPENRVGCWCWLGSALVSCCCCCCCCSCSRCYVVLRCVVCFIDLQSSGVIRRRSSRRRRWRRQRKEDDGEGEGAQGASRLLCCQCSAVRCCWATMAREIGGGEVGGNCGERKRKAAAKLRSL